MNAAADPRPGGNGLDAGPPPSEHTVETSRNDVVAGAIFIGIGLVFAVPAYGYGLGSFRAMEPGMFPFILGGILVVIGGLIVAEGLRGGEETPGLGRFPWRGAGCLLASLVWFTYTVDPLGLLISASGTALLACLASPAVTVLRALVTSAAIVAACYLIFVLALQLRLSLFPA